MKNLFRLLAVASSAALGLGLLSISGCGFEGPDVARSGDPLWVSAAQLVTFPADIAVGVAAPPTSPAVSLGATSMIFWQQRSPPESAFENVACVCRKLFYVSGGNLMVVDAEGATAYQPRKIDLGGRKAHTVASAGGGGPVIVSHPDDGSVTEVYGASEKVKMVIKLPGRTPMQLAVGQRFYALSGSLLVAFDERGEITTGDVGAGATGLDFSDSKVLVANPLTGMVYVFSTHTNICAPVINGVSAGCTSNDDTLSLVRAIPVPGAYKVREYYVIAAGSATGTPVSILSSGQRATGGFDTNYEIVADTTGQFLGPPPGPSQIVTNKPPAWTTVTGSSWMAPQPDQSDAARGGKYQNTSTTYETKFTVPDPSHVSLDFSVVADDYVDVKLNGKIVYTHQSTNMTGTPAKFTLNSGFVQGTNANLLDYVVSNTSGGPTGLSVTVVNTPAKAGTLYKLDLLTYTVQNSVPIDSCPVDLAIAHVVLGTQNSSGVFIPYSCESVVGKFDSFDLSHFEDIVVGQNPGAITILN